jgi:hypothetical protein
MPPRFVVRWTLYCADRVLTCIERAVPNGYECAVLYNGLSVARRLASNGRDVDVWTEQIRREWETAGWFGARPTHSSALVDQ